MTRRKRTKAINAARPMQLHEVLPPGWVDQYTALVALVGRCGARSYRVEHTLPENGPLAWVAVGVLGTMNGQPLYAAGGGITPWAATQALAAELLDGGKCTHCDRVAGVEAWGTPLDDDMGGFTDHVSGVAVDMCWYRYDPELKVYRRSCEGET